MLILVPLLILLGVGVYHAYVVPIVNTALAAAEDEEAAIINKSKMDPEKKIS